MTIAAIALFILLGVLAHNYNRSVFVWILIGFCISPVLALVVLFFLGED